MSWAADRNRSGDMGTSERLVLIAMAEPADVDGKRSFLAYGTIADRIGLSRRQVMRCIANLELAGLIKRAEDQRPAAYIPQGQRPIVWDLQLPDSKRRGVTPTTPVTGDTSDTQGRSLVTPVTPEHKTKPLSADTSVVEVTTTRAHAISAADDVDDKGRIHCTRCDVWAYPTLHVCAPGRPDNFADMVEAARLEAQGALELEVVE